MAWCWLGGRISAFGPCRSSRSAETPPPAPGYAGPHAVNDLQDPSGQYPETTGVTEAADRLCIQSLHAKGLGWLPR